MTRKSLIENIRNNMPQGLNKLEIARYIYIELGKERSFDARYFYGNTKTRKKFTGWLKKQKLIRKNFMKEELLYVFLYHIYIKAF